MKNNHADILIIGAGAAGATIAWSLSSSKYKILCFDQGDFTDPDLWQSDSGVSFLTTNAEYTESMVADNRMT